MAKIRYALFDIPYTGDILHLPGHEAEDGFGKPGKQRDVALRADDGNFAPRRGTL